jgi:hypothetical protein
LAAASDQKFRTDFLFLFYFKMPASQDSSVSPAINDDAQPAALFSHF